MSILQSLLGIRLVLKIGKDRPKPVPYDVIMALSNIRVEDNAVQRDLFQMTFTAGKRQAKDYGLLRTGLFQPRNRVAIALQIGAKVEPLISGVITNFELNPSNDAGMTSFTVTGEGIDLMFDLEEKNARYSQQDDTSILQTIVNTYAKYGLNLDISDEANGLEQPDDNHLIPRQYATDLEFIQQLAARNGFVFYSDPLPNGDVRFYWGPEVRKGPRQPPLTMNMGSSASANVTSLNFTHNTRTPVTASGKRLQAENDNTKREPISPTSDSEYKVDALAANEPFTDGVVLMREIAKYDTQRAGVRAKELMIARFNTITANGEVDTVRYGHIMRAGGVIGVRGAGALYNGDYYISKVTHSIQIGKYTQNFTLQREGLGAKSDRVRQSGQ
jgi:phage protein D